MYKVTHTGSSIEILLSAKAAFDMGAAKDCAYHIALEEADRTGAVVTVLYLGEQFLTVYPIVRPKRPIALTYIGTCSINHLADHCNGEGKSLLSIDCPASGVPGVMREQAQQALAIELSIEGDCDAPELCLSTRKELARHAIDNMYHSCLHPWDNADDRIADDPEGDVRIWFKLEY